MININQNICKLAFQKLLRLLHSKIDVYISSLNIQEPFINFEVVKTSF
jgi:hypothetical protein